MTFSSMSNFLIIIRKNHIRFYLISRSFDIWGEDLWNLLQDWSLWALFIQNQSLSFYRGKRRVEIDQQFYLTYFMKKASFWNSEYGMITNHGRKGKILEKRNRIGGQQWKKWLCPPVFGVVMRNEISVGR